MNPGDIVATRNGGKWRVRSVTSSGLVTAEHLNTGVVSHFDRELLTVVERHPGGPGAAA